MKIRNYDFLGMRISDFVFLNMAISLLVRQDLLQTLKLERPEVPHQGLELDGSGKML